MGGLSLSYMVIVPLPVETKGPESPEKQSSWKTCKNKETKQARTTKEEGTHRFSDKVDPFGLTLSLTLEGRFHVILEYFFIYFWLLFGTFGLPGGPWVPSNIFRSKLVAPKEDFEVILGASGAPFSHVLLMFF